MLLQFLSLTIRRKNNMYLLYIFIGLILTIVVETSLFVIFGFKDKKFILICVILNIITNLLINFILYCIIKIDSSAFIVWEIILEIVVALVEVVTYQIIYRKQYVLIPLSIAANALSFFLGIILYLVINNYLI